MQLSELFYALVVAQAFDILLGTLWAWQRKRIHSGIARRGMTRKAAVLIIAGFVMIQSKYLTPIVGIDVSALCLTYFIIAESISIFRYAALLGVPIPRSLRERLEEVQAELEAFDRRGDTNGRNGSGGGYSGGGNGNKGLLAYTLVDWGFRMPLLWWMILRGLRGRHSWRA
jgi:toxin secretion/phage lysis holin